MMQIRVITPEEEQRLPVWDTYLPPRLVHGVAKFPVHVTGTPGFDTVRKALPLQLSCFAAGKIVESQAEIDVSNQSVSVVKLPPTIIQQLTLMAK